MISILFIGFNLIVSVSYAQGSKIDPGLFLSKDGKIHLPIDKVDYRRDWAYLGSWLVTAKNDANGFHEVFTQPEAVDRYKKTGKFAVGTVLIKEIRSYQQSTLTTGPSVYHSSKNKVWFVMIKDSKGKYKGRSWGDGWGWALFDTKTKVSKVQNYKTGFM